MNPQQSKCRLAREIWASVPLPLKTDAGVCREKLTQTDPNYCWSPKSASVLALDCGPLARLLGALASGAPDGATDSAHRIDNDVGTCRIRRHWLALVGAARSSWRSNLQGGAERRRVSTLRQFEGLPQRENKGALVPGGPSGRCLRRG